VTQYASQPRPATAQAGAAASRASAALPARVRQLCWLLLVTAVANAVVDLTALTLHLTGDLSGGFGVAVRTVWALLRSLGFLILIWHLRNGRAGAWPLAIVLTVTTAFSAGRLAPLDGGWEPAQSAVVAGFVLVAALCAAVLLLFRSEPVRAHLTRRPPKWPAPSWVVTARVLAVSYAALMLIPCLVAFGTLFGDRRVGLVYAAPLVVSWLVLVLIANWIVPLAAFFLRRGHRWARAIVLTMTAFVLVTQPVLCLLLLGVDGLIRDAVPLVIAAVLVIYGLAVDRAGRAFFAAR
jgi:hypothetical protein